MTAITLTPRARVAGASYEVDHLGIAVPELDAATCFYRDVLGCPVSAPVCPQDQGIVPASSCSRPLSSSSNGRRW